MSSPTYKRSERVTDLLRENISMMLLTEVKDPRVQRVAVTHVQVTDDLRHAKVYYRFVGHEDEWNDQTQAEIERGLKKSAKFIRGSLGKRLRLKRVPELNFVFDHAIDNEARIESLLQGIADEQTDEDA